MERNWFLGMIEERGVQRRIRMKYMDGMEEVRERGKTDGVHTGAGWELKGVGLHCC